MKKIVLTGGGTAGHVTPNIALIEKLKGLNFEIHYIGQRASVEERLIKGLSGDLAIEYHKISAGKLRRQKKLTAMLKNFTDIFKVTSGIVEANKKLASIKPDVVFSKGGFVAVPVVLAAKIQKIPVVIHESDMTPGLTNRISIPFAENVCVSFKETAKYIKKNNSKDTILTGTPIRKQILEGDKARGKKLCEFVDDSKPKILVMGGSLGSVFINNILRQSLEKGLLKDFNIIHLTGEGNLDEMLNVKNYIQFEYLNQEMADILAYADFVVSRAGANTVFELLNLKKPNILVPLSKKVSRGDQIDNAKEFFNEGYSLVIEEEEFNSETLINGINELYMNKDKFIDKMNNSEIYNSVDKIIGVINASFAMENKSV